MEKRYRVSMQGYGLHEVEFFADVADAMECAEDWAWENPQADVSIQDMERPGNKGLKQFNEQLC